jgi:asparagine synthase (glutamine-hydrolysing)
MCGIVGIVARDPVRRVDEARVERMRDVLRHRGPDGEGLVVDGPAALGHRRLSIVDVAGGRQPMCNEDGTIWISFNGEIYNHASLRPGLESRGHRYTTRSDTETILHLYEEYGDGLLERLRGMFAFAIWDGPRRRLLLARDRLGIKPLYYAVTDDEILFASEIKAILAAGALKPAFDVSILPEFLATHFVSGDQTFFQGVRKLPPGCALTWSPTNGLNITRYWRLPAQLNDDGATLEARAREVRERLQGAVRSHLMSDVPLGLFLSGGIDSTGLAGLMAPLASEPIRTFAVGFDEPEANELRYARLAARSVGSEHREVVVSSAEFFQALPRLVWHEDEPIAFSSSVPLYFVSRLARDHVKVVLTGEGADELFLGYDRYRVTAWNERLGGAYWRLVPSAMRSGITRLVNGHRYGRRTFLALDPTPRRLFFDNFAAFSETFQRLLLRNPELLEARDPYAESVRCYDEPIDGGTLERMSHADLQTFLVELLMKQDQMSMAASIESRVPFLDHEFVEHAVGIPGRFKLHGWQTKAVLRAALRDLVPPEILTRPKMGFPVPVGRWLRGPFWPLVEDLVLGRRSLERGLFEPAELRRLAQEHRSGAANHANRLWLLLNLEIWQRMFLDGESVDCVSQGMQALCASSG